MLQIQSTYFSVHFQYAFLKYVAYLQSTYLKEKIRIGYVLKSANVGTLFSRKNSENSLKIHPTHMHTPMHIRAPPFCPLPPTPMHTFFRHHLFVNQGLTLCDISRFPQKN